MADKPNRPVRDWLKKVETTGPLTTRLRAAKIKDPTLYVGAAIRENGRYPHFGAFEPQVEVTSETQESGDEFYDAIHSTLVEWLAEEVQSLNREFFKILETEYDYQVSDEGVADSLDANEMHFDADGQPADLSHYYHIDQLPKPVAVKVIGLYSRMFGKTEEEVAEALLANKIKFDKRGNRVDTDEFKRVSELPPEVRKKVLEKHRYWNVEDNDWAHWLQENFAEERLQGWRNPQFEWELYGSVHAARILTDNVDLDTFIPEAEKHRQSQSRKQTSEARQVAQRVLVT